MIIKERTVEITRSDFVTLHNNTMYALSQLAMATNDNRGMTAEETMEVFKLIYPIVNGSLLVPDPPVITIFDFRLIDGRAPQVPEGVLKFK